MLVAVSAAFVGLLVAQSPTPASGPTSGALVGTWRLIEFWDRDSLTAPFVYPYGQRPTGYFTYDATGHLSIQIMRGPDPFRVDALRGESWFLKAAPEELRRAVQDYRAYFGTYTVDSAQGIVLHQVEGDSRGLYTGGRQRRRYRLVGDSLIIGNDSTSRRVLLRVPGLATVAPATAAQPIEDRYFRSDGVRLRYIDEGQGDAVVLVHGRVGGLQSFIDGGLVANLAKDHRVLALDLRGHGKSDKPRDPAAYPGQLTRDIARLLDHLGIRRAHMVGYSLGGALVAKLLTERPDRVVTATIGASPGHRLSRWKTEARRNIGDDTSGFEVYYRGGHRDTYFTDEQFAVTQVPVLGIVGSEDGSLAGMRELQALLPGMTLVVIDGATHTGPRNAPGRPEFAQAIRAFIRSHE